MPESMEKLMAMEIYFTILIVAVRIQNDTSGHVKNYRVIFAVYRFFCPGTNIHARDNKADCDVVVTSNLLPIFLKFILKFFRHVYSFLFFFVLFIHFFFLIKIFLRPVKSIKLLIRTCEHNGTSIHA